MRSKRKREIGREVIDEVRRKVKLLKRPEETSIRLVLVYEGLLDRTLEAAAKAVKEGLPAARAYPGYFM